MSRTPQIDHSMAAAMFGLQQPGASGPAVALALVTYLGKPWSEPTGSALERAHATAERFRLSPDLVRFIPAEPRRLAGRSRTGAFRGVIMALKQLDALEDDDRTEAIAQLTALLGTGQR